MAKTTNKYAAVFALIKHIQQFDSEYTSETAVSDFTNGVSKSLRDIPDNKLPYLVEMLKRVSTSPSKPKSYADDPHDKQRKAIIAIFKSHGKTVEDAKAWAKRQGVKGVHKEFNDYNGQELFTLTRQAENFLRK